MIFFFFNDTATTEIYTLSLHDALPIFRERVRPALAAPALPDRALAAPAARGARVRDRVAATRQRRPTDRKSTRLNSSHANISYAVFCLKKNSTTFTPLPSIRSHFCTSL